MPTITHAKPVTISLASLLSNSIPFTTLEEAFGPSSLGILVVTDLPSTFPELRSTVLANSSRLAALPKSKLDALTDEKAKYLVGWSHGKETLRPGVVDDKKGSFYINCAFASASKDKDDKTTNKSIDGSKTQSHNQAELDQDSDEDKRRFPDFPEYTAPSLWPDEADIPGFRDSAESLIRLIIDVAVLVARACDRYAEAEIDGYQPGYLEKVVRASRTSKARLLHYFPDDHDDDGDADRDADAQSADNQVQGQGQDKFDDTWCTTHLDHGCLTGLTSAMFVDETETSSRGSTTTTTTTASSPSASPSSSSPASSSSSPSSPAPGLSELATSPDPTSGLYIHSRTGAIVKVAIPRDSLAFQTGETLQLMTKGRFKAVPHFVKGVEARNLVRESTSDNENNDNNDEDEDENENGASERKKTTTTTTTTTRRRIARNTLAVFTQPNLADVVDLDTGLTFGEFARGVVRKNTA